MEEKKCEELKSILSSIKEAVELYNQLNPPEKIQVVPEKQLKDVSKISICVYNEGHVGLFKKMDYHHKPIQSYFDNRYDAGIIYLGVDSAYVGIKITHCYYSSYNDYASIGSKLGTTVANCKIESEMSFDDMRLIMVNAGVLTTFELGKATDEEIVEVLNYAMKYYQLNGGMKLERKNEQ